MKGRPQLAELAKPFPPHLVRELPGAFSAKFVPWADIQQRLLYVLDQVPTWRTLQHWEANGTAYAQVELECVIDGHQVTVQAIGDNDNKDPLSAESRARARACALIGLGLHMWAPDTYRLDINLETQLQDE